MDVSVERRDLSEIRSISEPAEGTQIPHQAEADQKMADCAPVGGSSESQMRKDFNSPSDHSRAFTHAGINL